MAKIVRLGRDQIRARVKALSLTFSPARISAHGGLELLRLFLVLRGFAGRVRQTLAGTAVDGDYGAMRMLLTVVADRSQTRRHGQRRTISYSRPADDRIA